MKLPYNLVIQPGVRQLPNGKLYRLGSYPSGKSVMVPYEDTDAPKAQMIPEYVEPVKARRVLTAKRTEVKRELHIRWRSNGEKEVDNHVLDFPRQLQAFIPLCTSPDLGASWRFITDDHADFYNIWHEDVKETP